MNAALEMMSSRLGELAALGAALAWVVTSLCFAAAGRRIGAMMVNFLRIMLALVVLASVHRMVLGHWIPGLDRTSVLLLGLSGIIGLVIGDQFLFIALVDVGPRLATLLMTVTPPVAVLLSWRVLDEPLGMWAIGGIAVTIAGIGWVVLERPEGVAAHTHRRYVRGTIFGVLAGICNAVGLVIAKLGMGHMREGVTEFVNPWTATMVRMAFAAVGITLLVIMHKMFRRTDAAEMIDVSPESEHLPLESHSPEQSALCRVILMVVLGTICGPVVGVWLSMVAVDKADTGVAATLMAMSPVFILPFAVWIEKERLSWRAIVGAGVAVVGVVMLTATPPAHDELSMSINLSPQSHIAKEPDA